MLRRCGFAPKRTRRTGRRALAGDVKVDEDALNTGKSGSVGRPEVVSAGSERTGTRIRT